MACTEAYLAAAALFPVALIAFLAGGAATSSSPAQYLDEDDS